MSIFIHLFSLSHHFREVLLIVGLIWVCVCILLVSPFFDLKNGAKE